MQRENKWQDRFRDKFGEHILKVELHSESLNESISYSSIENEIISFIQSEIDTAIAEERKAFGGCTKCYGKGYATVRYGFNAHADFIGDKSYEYGTKTHMEYCTCDRGEQLKNLIQ